MKKNILVIIISISCSLQQEIIAQTNVSGGIFANTTWTQVGSPYIVTGSVVVFPGYSLTIEPGVTVKFNDQQYLEIRQATLIAEGTSAAPITFTSNALSPVPGIWGHANYGGVWLNGAQPVSKINHCTISYATTGLEGGSVSYIKNSRFIYNSQYGVDHTANTTDSCIFSYNEYGIGGTGTTLSNCVISNNTYGIGDAGNVTITNCRIDSNGIGIGGPSGLSTRNLRMYNCTLSYNGIGLRKNGWGVLSIFQNCVISHNSNFGIVFGQESDSLIDCEIKFNQTGVSIHYTSDETYITRNVIENNNVGIRVLTSTPHVYCNRICNNTFAGLEMITSANVSVANNYWCTSDSATTAFVIYDGYDNATLGLAYFLPLDSLCAPISTSLNEIIAENFPFNIFPNPATSEIRIESSKLKVEGVEIYDVLGEKVISQQQTQTINVSTLSPGIYFVKVKGEKEERVAKFVKL